MDFTGNPVVITHEASIDSNGGTVAVSPVGASVTVPQGSVAARSSVKLSVTHRQFDKVLRDHYMFSPHGVVLHVTPNDLGAAGEMHVRLPVQGAYDRQRTLIGVKTASGQVLSLQNEKLSSDGKSLEGTLTKPMLNNLRGSAPPTAPLDLMAFTANRMELTAAPTLITGVYQWNGAQFVQPVQDLTGKNVALCIHGINNALSDLNPLAGFLAQLQTNGAPMYDLVIGFQYSSNAPLALIGTAMAQQVNAVLTGAASTDLIAHSMGNVVARYALETVGLPTRLGPLIRRYISLAGPHQGLPFGDLGLLKSLLYVLPVECLPCLKDLMTEGANGQPDDTFLQALNTKTQGPDYATAQYFTLSGNAWGTYGEPVAATVQGLYVAADLFNHTDWSEDGLVAVYSAQSAVLANQSSIWQVGPTLPLNHHQFVTDPSAFAQITTWLQAP